MLPPLFPFSDGISMIYVCIHRANRFCPSHFHTHRSIIDPIPRSLDINRRNRPSLTIPVFSHVKALPILGRYAPSLNFFVLLGPSYGPKCLSTLVSPSFHEKDDSSPPLRSSRRDSRFKKKKGSPNSTRRTQKPPGKLSFPHFPHPPFKVAIEPQSVHQNANPTVRIERMCKF